MSFTKPALSGSAFGVPASTTTLLFTEKLSLEEIVVSARPALLRDLQLAMGYACARVQGAAGAQYWCLCNHDIPPQSSR